MINGVAAVWLPVSDMDRSVAFYGDTLGLTVTEHDGDWSEVDANGVKIGLNGTESPSGDGGALIAFQPDGDLDAEVDRLKGAGVDFPTRSPSTRGVGSCRSRTPTATTSSSTPRPSRPQSQRQPAAARRHARAATRATE